MIDYSILSQKPTVALYRNGKYETIKDLTSKTYNNVALQGGNILIVEDYYIARPDLISLAVYGNDKYADIICKINGISNPFELNKNMILYLPDISIINASLTGTRSENDILEEFKTKKNISNLNNILKKINKNKNQNNSLNTTKETIEKKKTSIQKLRNERRTPGDQTITDNNYYIDKSLGLVIY